LRDLDFQHGGNIYFYEKKLNLPITHIIDASASIVPFSVPHFVLNKLHHEINKENFRYYPEKNLYTLREIIGNFHNIKPCCIMPGNGASELITWAGLEASKYKSSTIPIPGFVDYIRALNCWKANYDLKELPMKNLINIKQAFPLKTKSEVLWITNPHNPTGQLWDRKSLEELIKHYKLIICDEAFLSITPNGENESLIPLTKEYDNLIIIRSLTKLFSIPGLRLGYMISSPKRLENLNNLRDPWPVNSLAIQVGIELLNQKNEYKKWTKKIHKWINVEKKWLSNELEKIEPLKVHESSTNFFLIESKNSLFKNINYLEKRGILIRECSSFKSLGNNWARISLQTHHKNKLIAKEFQKSFL
tara:strand:- start:1325 stop:2407 length:1083 start_codon:yes stop_codon:yes gene_type:complete